MPNAAYIPPPRRTIILLAATAALGSLATQLLIPALPEIAREMRIGIGSAQLIIGVFLAGLGTGQLLVGPVADRWGRRPVLIAGLCLYALSSLGASVAHDLPMLLLGRAGQALGASAGIVTARVILNDLYPPHKAASAQATLMAIILVSPALAPVIGGWMTEFMGWRTILIVLTVAGALGALMVAQFIPMPRCTAALPAGLAHSYRRIARNRTFWAATATLGLSSAALFLFLGAAPFLLTDEFGLSPREIGLCLLVIAVASIAGTRMVGLATHYSDPLLTGTASGFAGILLLLLLAAIGVNTLAAFIGPMMLLGLGAGMTGPSAISRIIASEAGIEATATSLAGALQMAVSGVAGYAFGPYATQSVLHLAITLTALTGVALAAAIMVIRKTQPIM